MPLLTIRKTRRRNSHRRLTGSLLHGIATLVLTACVPCLSTCLMNKAHSAEKRRVPNIVLIMIDDK